MSEFRDRLDKASLVEAIIATMLSREGFWVKLSPMSGESPQGPDIQVLLTQDKDGRESWGPIEVKSSRPRNKAFRSIYTLATDYKVRMWGNVSVLPVPFVKVWEQPDGLPDMQCFLPGTKLRTESTMDLTRRSAPYNVECVNAEEAVTWQELINYIKETQGGRQDHWII